jgi:hypothetical protein
MLAHSFKVQTAQELPLLTNLVGACGVRCPMHPDMSEIGIPESVKVGG